MASLPQRIRAKIARDRRWANVSFSQFGEDLALLRYFEGRRGFYVDIGACHPVRFSNTYLLNQRGWSGINVDANPESLNLFRSRRPRDINIHAAVSDTVREVEFSLYQESALCRIEVQSGAAAEGNPQMPPPVKKLTIQSTTLANLLATHVSAEQKMDLLNIDCEGHDLAVLTSNDWKRFRPEIVAVEDWDENAETDISRFLLKRGYELIFLNSPAKLFARKT
jgi:FkbM family methyltransferase